MALENEVFLAYRILTREEIRSNWTQGGSIQVLLRKPTATCDFQGRGWGVTHYLRFLYLRYDQTRLLASCAWRDYHLVNKYTLEISLTKRKIPDMV